MRKRGKGWLIEISRGRGQPRVYYTHHGTKEEAFQLEHAMKVEMARKKPNDRHLVAHLVDKYLEHVRLHQAESTHRWKKYYFMTALIPFFGNQFIDAISEEMIEIYKAKRKKEIHHASATKDGNRLINLEILALKAMAKWAGCEIKAKKLPDKPRLPDVMTRAETKAFLDAIEDPTDRALFITLYGTGMRRSEVFSLRWHQVNLQAGKITTIGKGSKMRMIPILPLVHAALSEHDAKCSDKDRGSLVFPSTRTRKDHVEEIKRVDIRKAIERARKKAGIAKRITPHSLRHAFGTHIFDVTGDLNTLRELMGHTDFRVTKIYVQVSEEHKKEVMQKGLNF